MKELLKEISNLIRRGDVTFLAGAGISHPRPSNLPIAGQIVTAVLSSFYERSSCLKQLFESERSFVDSLGTLRFESLLQTLYESMNELAILDLFNGGKPNPIHSFLVQCMSLGNKVITTNFDRLIEAASPGNELVVCSTNEEFQNAFQNMKSDAKVSYLFKIHGSVDNQDSIKATLNQVGQSGIGFANEEGKAQVFDKLVKESNLIVIGYSGSDDFDIIPRLLYNNLTKTIYWINHNPDKTSPLRILDKNEYAENWHLLSQNSNIIVISGDTLNFIKLLSDQLFDLPLVYEKETITEIKHKNLAIRHRINKIIDDLAKGANGWIEFISGLLLYKGNRRSEAQKCWEASSEIFQKNEDFYGVARSFTNLSVVYADQMNDEIALEYLDISEKIYHSTSDKRGRAYVLRNKAAIFTRNGEWLKALRLFAKSRALYKQCNDRAGYASATNSMAQIYTDLGKYEKATKLFFESNTIHRELGDLIGYAMSLGNSARLLYAKNHLEEAEFVFKIALDTVTKLGDFESMAKILNNLGMLYAKQGRFDEAERAFNEAEASALKIGDPTAELDAKINRGTMLLHQGQLDTALQLLEEGIILAQKLNAPERYAQAAGNIGLTLLDAGNPKSSIKYFDLAKEAFEKLGARFEKAFSDENIGDAYTKLGELKKARIHYELAYLDYQKLGMKEQLQEIEKKCELAEISLF